MLIGIVLRQRVDIKQEYLKRIILLGKNGGKIIMTKKLYFVVTNGYNMLVSMDKENNCRYLTETEEFPYIIGLEKDGQQEKALEFLNIVEDDSSWEDAGKIENLEEWLNLDGHLGDPSEIVAEIEKDL